MALKHTDLARELAQGIADGRFPVGSLLPTELELCEHHAASRYTVRLALGELQEQGLISRRKNVGTRVEAARPTAGFRQSLASVEDLAQFGATHVRTVRRVEEVVTDLALAAELGCPGGTRWLRISSLRMNGEHGAAPIGWTDVYVDPAYADLRDVVRETPDVLISNLIESRYGRRVAEIRQDVQGVLVPPKLAPELQADAGTPALRIVRHYVDLAGQAFVISVTIHPADRFTFSLRLRRDRD
jgi:GntR family transcriptional regulator